jgi:hypothetical protein
MKPGGADCRGWRFGCAVGWGYAIREELIERLTVHKETIRS